METISSVNPKAGAEAKANIQKIETNGTKAYGEPKRFLSQAQKPSQPKTANIARATSQPSTNFRLWTEGITINNP